MNPEVFHMCVFVLLRKLFEYVNHPQEDIRTLSFNNKTLPQNEAKVNDETSSISIDLIPHLVLCIQGFVLLGLGLESARTAQRFPVSGCLQALEPVCCWPVVTRETQTRGKQ